VAYLFGDTDTVTGLVFAYGDEVADFMKQHGQSTADMREGGEAEKNRWKIDRIYQNEQPIEEEKCVC